jgi:ribosomal protein L32
MRRQRWYHRLMSTKHHKPPQRAQAPCPEKGHAATAPVLYECPACRHLSTDAGFASGSSPCPSCGEKGVAHRMIPADHLRRFDERIRNYHDDGENEIVVILVSTFLETLFEDILSRMMEAAGAEKRVIALVLDTERSVGMRLGKLFPTLSGAKFEDVAAELGYNEFPRGWREMRAARNAFIHGESFTDPRTTLDHRTACAAMGLLDQAYDLFVLINNRYVASAVAPKNR